MQKFFLLFALLISYACFSQGRPINKLTLQSTYSSAMIHKSLVDLIEQADKPSYFDDTFFNDLLKKILLDKQFSEKEKVQLFYLMQKKLGYAFIGINYLPPQQNYFTFFNGEVLTWQKTRSSLKALNYNPSALLALVSSEQKTDVVIASNALLLATLVNADSAAKKMEHYSQLQVIQEFVNPDIFNHYLCLSAAIRLTEPVRANLIKNVLGLKKEAQIEDALCALYSGGSPLSTIKDYIVQESDPDNDLSMETALCALASKVPQATFEKSIQSFIDAAREKWKKELLKNILTNKIPFNYSLTNKELLVTKTWEGVTLSLYTDGALITNGALTDFDPN